jgi:Protein of unknown function (DUF3293)/Phytanoyl-CoA dioxygenase (PhyH)
MTVPDLLPTIERDGFCLLRGAFSEGECNRLLAEWQMACEKNPLGVMRSATGAVYGARNLLGIWPDVLRVAHQPTIRDALRQILGPQFGVVRVLYFDKPPGESWALPWHKDLAVAVRDNRLASDHFGAPTTKYGVPHVEAPTWLLAQMVTARLHLDEVTDENGPLRVIPGSHRDGKESGATGNEVRILCHRGDVLLIRPLVSHASGHSRDGTTRHRRILHLEFSGIRKLPDGYQWHTFIQLTGSLEQLETVYRETDYHVDEYPTGPFTIRIGEPRPEVADVEWAFVTACNPHSKPLSEAENDRRMAELANAVSGRWRHYRGHGVGRDGSWREPSLLIVGIREPDAVELARRFGQNAIVAGGPGERARLVWV